VFAISVQVVPPSVEDCHFTTEPVLPLKVIEPLLLPLHTVAAPEVEPPTEAAFTVIELLPLKAWLQVLVVFWMLVSVTVVLAASAAVVMLNEPGPVPVMFLAVAPSV
jgi:hypothetical protein